MARISIEVGHGGKDVGALTKDGRVYEKNINLAVSLELKRQLARHGQEILISREKDCDDLARDFFPKAKAWKPNMHISVHTNAFNGAAKGFEVFQSSIAAIKGESYELCKCIESEVKLLGQTSRGIKDSPFLLSSLPCVSAYLELGFMDNPDDYKNFDTAEKQKSFAKAYAKGILNYLGVKWQDEKTSASSPSSSSTTPANKNTSDEKIVYRVVTGSYSDKKNAEAWAEELKKDGFESFLVAEKV